MHNINSTDSIYDKIAVDYQTHFDAKRFRNENSYISNFIRSRISGNGNLKSVLDLGCGTGLGYDLCGKILSHAFDYTGVDSSKKMLNLARSNLYSLNNNSVRLVCDDAMEYLKYTERTDLVISLYGSPSHFDVPLIDILRGVRDILSNNGVAILMFYAPPPGINSGAQNIKLNGMSVFASANCYSLKDLNRHMPRHWKVEISSHYSFARHIISDLVTETQYTYLESLFGRLFPNQSRYTTLVMQR